MKHLGQEDLVSHYYEQEAGAAEHLGQCRQCRDAFSSLSQWLDGLQPERVPEPAADYERHVWTRVAGQLPAAGKRHRRRPSRAWVAVAIAAAALVLLTVVPRTVSRVMSVQRARAAGQRVVNGTLTQYLGQTQVLLTEVTHHLLTEPERQRARKLVEDGRLLRAVLRQHGEGARAAALESLEPALLTLANGSVPMKADEWQALRDRVSESGLVFKVTVMRSNLTRGTT